MEECGDHWADGDDAQSVGLRGLDGLVDENRCETASLERVVYLGVNENPPITAICERCDSDGLPSTVIVNSLPRWVTVAGAPVLSVVLSQVIVNPF
jgi:hypothetical protein